METWILIVIIVVASVGFTIVTVAIGCLCWRYYRKGRNDFNYQSYIDDDVESQRRASSNGRTETRPHVKHPSRAKTINEEIVRGTKGAGRKPRSRELPRVTIINDETVGRYIRRGTTTGDGEIGPYFGRGTTTGDGEIGPYFGRGTTTGDGEIGPYFGRGTTTGDGEIGPYFGRGTTTGDGEIGPYFGRGTTTGDGEIGPYFGRGTTTGDGEIGPYFGRGTTTGDGEIGPYFGRGTTTGDGEIGPYFGRGTTTGDGEIGPYFGRGTTTGDAGVGRYFGRGAAGDVKVSRYFGRGTTTGEGNLSHTVQINGGSLQRISNQGITVRKDNVSSSASINERTILPGLGPVRESMAQWLSQQQKALNKFTSTHIHNQNQTISAQRPAVIHDRNSVEQFTSASTGKFNTSNGYRKINTRASIKYPVSNFSTSPGYSQSNVNTPIEYPILDLHNYTLKEAMEVFKTFLSSSISDYIKSNYIRNKRFCEVITGRGKHCPDGVPVIKPAVENYLKTHNYTFNWSNPGRVRIDLLSFRNMAESD